MDPHRDPVLRLHRVHRDAIAPMRADRSALGTMPTAAYQYCEALCSASAFGWYVFPPCDLRLRWDGAEVFHERDGEWHVLTSHVPEALAALWDARCPRDLVGKVPPMLTSLFVPGLVQVWSGFLVSTAPGWSVLVRPLVNLVHTRAYRAYEAVVETDEYGPWPLFMNIQLTATDTDIAIVHNKPLFQVQPIPRAAYRQASSAYDLGDAFGVDESGAPAGSLSADDWSGFRATVRAADPVDDEHDVGQYAAGVRRRAKDEDR